MNKNAFPFQREVPAACLLEIERLQTDGYVIHKEWANGIELRKGKPFRGWLLGLQVLFPMWLFPGVMRCVVDNLFGYKYRVLVARDPEKATIRFV